VALTTVHFVCVDQFRDATKLMTPTKWCVGFPKSPSGTLGAGPGVEPASGRV